MDKQKTLAMWKEIQTAIDAVLVKHKCTLSCSSPRYSPTMFRFKVEVTDGNAPVSVKESFIPGGELPAKGVVFTYGPKTFKVSGYRKGRDFTWVLADRVPDGKTFRFRPFEIPPTANTTTGKKRTEAEILEDIRDVECGLSPENLSCDGEASRTHIKQRSAQLNAKMRALVAELGRTPTKLDSRIYTVN